MALKSPYPLMSMLSVAGVVSVLSIRSHGMVVLAVCVVLVDQERNALDPF